MVNATVSSANNVLLHNQTGVVTNVIIIIIIVKLQLG
jgi:hypothetical protein